MHKNIGNVVQFIKFVLVGVSNTVLSEAIYVVLVLLGWNYLLANFMGFAISVLNAYYWSNRYVFKEDVNGEKRVWYKVLLKTYAAYFWGFLINFVLLFLEIDVLKIGRFMTPISDVLMGAGLTSLDEDTVGKLVAEGINLILTVPMNFLINKYWAYRQKGI